MKKEMFVPNVPCGVESNQVFSQFVDLSGFLMYRVELKVAAKVRLEGAIKVGS